ncbi:hypothetical protein BJY26_003092 [Spelaeicoccus albus]|uniref:Uncharacterized protein n=1 Tax=Spelaeicoccus albus TaxID=1280376 RepID=A0A7Z0D4M7_9MICO|nr:hypothetical protein [Spelaeicoccus albus]
MHNPSPKSFLLSERPAHDSIPTDDDSPNWHLSSS